MERGYILVTDIDFNPLKDPQPFGFRCERVTVKGDFSSSADGQVEDLPVKYIEGKNQLFNSS